MRPSWGRVHGNDGTCASREPGSGVVQALAQYHQGHTRLARHAGVAIGHVRRGLLVAGCNHADARLIAQRGDNPVHLHTRDAEDDLDTFGHERLDEGLAPTHFHHGAPISPGSQQSGGRSGYGDGRLRASGVPAPANSRPRPRR